MNSVIKVLDQHSANQIAAGEVVERPLSVVKELVENSLDAGAKHIQVSVEGSGVDLIQVRDDGWGIAPADLSLALIRHATSKLSKIEDLDTLETLGFRGEALPSIASVSHFEILSRRKDEISGQKLVLKAGQLVAQQEVGSPFGTTVTVQDLFFNTPARRKFLRSANTEFGLISDMLGRLALAHPGVAFSLTHPRQVVLQTSGQGQLLESIGSVLGNELARRLLPISCTRGAWQLEGYISPPDLVRSSKQGITFMVNGRVIHSTVLNRSLQDGYHTLIPAKLYPLAVLHLHLPPNAFDVNVHPTKMEVRFHQEKELSEFISEYVYQSLLTNHPLPRLGNMTTAHYSNISRQIVPSQIPGVNEPSKVKYVQMPIIEQLPHIVEQSPNQAAQIPKQVAQTPNQVAQTQYEHDSSSLGTGELFLTDEPETSENPLRSLYPVGQIFNTYILASDGGALFIIDQHAAHERVNYERLLKEIRELEISSQTLLIPIWMEFTLQEEQVILEHLWALRDMGFVLEHFGPRTYLVRGVPACSGPVPSEELLRQFIDQVLRQSKTPTLDQLLEEWIYLLACKESIKAKDKLSILEMEQLISRLAQTENPYTCPHGRPTIITMSKEELEKRFYRR